MDLYIDYIDFYYIEIFSLSGFKLIFFFYLNGLQQSFSSNDLHYLNLLDLTVYIYIYAFSRRFYPKRLTVQSGYTFFVSMCVP